jgi:hypothetical protein
MREETAKPRPDPLPRGTGVKPLELLEQPGASDFIDARLSIGDLSADAVSCASKDTQLHPAGIGVLHRIAKQIQQYLTKPDGVCDDV